MGTWFHSFIYMILPPPPAAQPPCLQALLAYDTMNEPHPGTLVYVCIIIEE